MFFPNKYVKPVLQSIVEASANGWDATCSGGTTPGTGGDFCSTGATAGSTKDGFNGVVYTHSNKSSHLLDPEDVGEGL